MKEVIIIFAVFIAVVTSVDLVPILGNSNRVSALMGKSKPITEIEGLTKRVSKHNLNTGQLKKMYWLRYVDKA
jgi:hypothetical protein